MNTSLQVRFRTAFVILNRMRLKKFNCVYIAVRVKKKKLRC